MTKLLALTVLLGGNLAIAADTRAAIDRTKQPFITDRLFYGGPEGNQGAELGCKFFSPQRMARAFELDKVIGRFKSEKHPFGVIDWTLWDILVSADLNGGGTWVTWRISGPAPLVKDYITSYEIQDKPVCLEFSWKRIDYRPSGD